MHRDMMSVLDYNFEHFYGRFREIVVTEMLDNLESALAQINNGRIPGNPSPHHQRFEYSAGYLNEVKLRLLK
jgi:hypothetical protein